MNPLFHKLRDEKEILTKPKKKVNIRKGLRALSVPENLDMRVVLRWLTSLDCGRDSCSAVCGGCSNVWDSMTARDGWTRNLEVVYQICSNSGSSENTHAINWQIP